jgi:hypothetical protein
MIPFSLGFLTCLTAFFRSRCSLSLEVIVLRHQLSILKQKDPHPLQQIPIECFGFRSVAFGLPRVTCWSSPSQRRLSLGTALVFVCSGGFDPVQTKADPKQMPNYGG